jgi:cytochrome c peroxidase
MQSLVTPLALALAVASIAALAPAVAARAQSGESLEDAFGRWARWHEARGGDRRVELALGWSKAFSERHTPASGVAVLDLVRGGLRVEVEGLDGGDVWLVDNRDGRSAGPDPSDRQVFAGALSPRGSGAALSAPLAGLPADFEVDLVAVTRPGASPGDGGLLFGAPGLWQRRYTAWRRGQRQRRPQPTLDQLVARGEALFFEETFGGNGRTCGTCHPAQNNFTLDVEFIAALPDGDPLFVAEFVPALARNFEKPALMRELALILENTNGFEDPQRNFTMRSVPHTLALKTSLTPDAEFPMEQATGWSGDGAPAGGSLRQFANGAIRQHFPRTLNREEGVDFRFATDEELDAMEAFQLSLGRDGDPDVTPGSVTELALRSPLAERGKQLFNDTDTSDGSAGKCARCHDNAGANALSSGTNDNFATGVEALSNPRAAAIVAATGDANLADDPPDDGLGSPGDGTFNTPSLVEAADTAPFFHDNSAETLEDAVDFYNSAAFAESPSGQFLSSQRSGEANGIAIHLEADEVAAVAAFLRVLNALENVRSAQAAVRSAAYARRPYQRIAYAAAETSDAARVLAEAGLHAGAVRDLVAAERTLRSAAGRRSGGRALSDALGRLASARRQLVVR